MRCAVPLIVLLVPTLLNGGNWPQFRGPDATGVSQEKNLADAWSTTENVAWKVTIPGLGWSSPIVWGDKVLLTSVISEGKVEDPKKGLYMGGDRPKPPAEPHRWIVYCLDVNTGRVLWERQAHKGVPASPRHLKNTYASETPTTDGERVYAYFGSVGLFCYDFNGKEVWSQKWEPLKTRLGWGTASSPVLHGDRLYIVNDNEEKSFLLALDKKTGKQVWRVDRDERSNWATPFIWENENRTEIITSGSNKTRPDHADGKVRSYDLNGKLLWELTGMSTISIPTPFAKHGLLYIASGFILDRQQPLYAIRPGAAGDITLKEGETQNENIVWSHKKAAAYNPSPIVVGDHLYVLLDRGFLACYDARTGKEVYGRQRLDQGSTAFTASPWSYDGKIFCLSEDGDTFVVQAGAEYKVLRKNSLDEMCMASPAIANASLFIRTASKLYCIRKAGPTAGR